MNIPSSCARAGAGFSLIEVLCAILILGVGITGLTVGMSTAVRSSKETEWQTAAALLAAGHLETLRAEGYVIAGEEEGEFEDGLSIYQWKHAVTETAVEGLYEVEVAVVHAPTGQTLYRLQTLLFDPPVYAVPYETEDEQDSDQGSETGRARGGER